MSAVILLATILPVTIKSSVQLISAALIVVTFAVVACTSCTLFPEVPTYN